MKYKIFIKAILIMALFSCSYAWAMKKRRAPTKEQEITTSEHEQEETSPQVEIISVSIDPTLEQRPLSAPVPEQAAANVTKIHLQAQIEQLKQQIEQLKQQEDVLSSKIGALQSRHVSAESVFKRYEKVESTLKEAQEAEKAGNSDLVIKKCNELLKRYEAQIAYLENTLSKLGTYQGEGISKVKISGEEEAKIRTYYEAALEESRLISEKLKLSHIPIEELLTMLFNKKEAAQKNFSKIKKEFEDNIKPLAEKLKQVRSDLKKTTKEVLDLAEKDAMLSIKENAPQLTSSQIKTNIKELKKKFKYATTEETKTILTTQIRIFEDELKSRKDRVKNLKKVKAEKKLK